MASEIFGLLVGFTFLIAVSGFIYFYYRIFRPLIASMDMECKYLLLEELKLEKIAGKAGYDLEKELQKRKIIQKNKKDIAAKVKEELYDELFGKQKKLE